MSDDPKVIGVGASQDNFVVVEVGQDRAFQLEPEAAVRHAMGVLAASQQAEYDLAVISQFATMGLPPEGSARVLRELRQHRPPLDPADVAPLVLAPALDPRTCQASVRVAWGEEFLGFWDQRDAWQHACYVLSSVNTGRLDAAYCAFLIEVTGASETRARDLVRDVMNHVTCDHESHQSTCEDEMTQPSTSS